jgi:hypothetical protein
VSVSDYTALVTSQYQNSTKYLAWLSANLQYYEDITDCADTFIDAFDIDLAIGVQLDMIGVVVGCSRTVNFQPSNSVSPILDDDTYRILLKATILGNQWDGKIDSLATAWSSLFPGGTIVIDDTQLMEMNITVIGSLSSILLDLINNGYIVPRPEGVLINIGSGGTLPYFGFDRDNQYVSGFDVGNLT